MEKRKPLINFAHICDMAFLSQDGKLNIIGVFRNIKAQKIPFVYPRFTCALNMSIQETSRLKIQILNQESRELLSKMEGTLTPQKNEGKLLEVGFIGDFQNIRFEKAGTYDLEIWINDELIQTLSFFIQSAPQ